jgi:chorismate mutase
VKFLASALLGLTMARSEEMVPVSDYHGEAEQGALADLVDLTVGRLWVIEELAVAKFWADEPVIDPAWDRLALCNVRSQAVRIGLDVPYAVRFFQAQITAGRILEQSLIVKWHAKRMPVLTAPPHPQAVRNRLDLIDLDLICSLLAVWESSEPWPSRVIDLHNQKQHVGSKWQLDNLRRRVLAKALSPIVS